MIANCMPASLKSLTTTMANREVENLIIKQFRAAPAATLTTSKIISTCRRPKKTLNQCLYSLMRRGVLEKVNDVPPVWRLKTKTTPDPGGTCGGVSTSMFTADMGYSNKQQNDMSQQVKVPALANEEPGDIISHVLWRLRLSSQPVAAHDIARSINCDEYRVAALLREMFAQDIVISVGETPVKWILKNDPGSRVPRFVLQDSLASRPVTPSCKGDHYCPMPATEVHPRPRTLPPTPTNVFSIPAHSSEVTERITTNTDAFASRARSSIPLPPHMLLQQRSFYPSQQIVTAPACNSRSEDAFVSSSRALSAAVNRSLDSSYERPFKIPSPMVCHQSNTAFANSSPDRHEWGPSPDRHEWGPSYAEMEDESFEGTATKDVSAFSPSANIVSENIPAQRNHVRELSGNIPRSPAAILLAEIGGNPKSPLLRAQANLLDALNPRMGDEEDESETMDFHETANSIPDCLMGLAATELSNATTITLNSDSFAALNRNPISVLTEYAQSRKTTVEIKVLLQKGPPNRPKFHMAAIVGSRQYPTVVAPSKRDGRKDAADAALRILMKEGQFNSTTVETSPKTDVANLSRSGTHFDKMAALSHQAYNLLAATVPENLSGRKVLAALIMKRGIDDDGTVISLGTGNRCITGPEMSLEGHTVNDSHAEIVTRRGFVRFLYKHLCQYAHGTHENVLFEEAPSGKLRIKKNISFHLYISTAPCGDGALFSPRDEADSQVSDKDNRREHQPTFDNKLQGILRTKIEGGEGTIPIASGSSQQTWDGILRGERLRTMSCSDKLCRWNVLGLQGALLANFLEPVYMDTLTLGYLYDYGHLCRAVCCRMERHVTDDNNADVAPLPPPFRVNHPHLGRVTSYEPVRGTDKTKAISLNWCAGDVAVEMVDGTLGQVMNRNRIDIISRVAKKKLFAAYQLSSRRRRPDLATLGQSYKEAKDNAVDYQEAKRAMFARFKQGKFGIWVQKPIEEKMFFI